MNKKIVIPLLLAGVGVYLLTQQKKTTASNAINVKPKDTQQFGYYDTAGNWIPQQIKIVR